MSLGLELAFFADQVPFLAEHHYRKLTEIKEGSPMPESIGNIWAALALLIERYNDQTIRVVMKQNCPKNHHGISIVRVGVYEDSEWLCDHDFPLKGDVVDELIRNGYVKGTPRWGYTDETELKLTEYGRRALVDYLNSLS